MSQGPSTITLDFHQWGALLRDGLVRLNNFVENYTVYTERFGPVDASVVAQFHEHADNMKRMATAWGVAFQKEMAKSQTRYSPISNLSSDQPQSSSTSQNGAEGSEKRKRGRPRKDENAPRVRANPRQIAAG